MSEFNVYINEIMNETSHIFYSLRSYVEELARVLLLEGIYIEKVVASVTCVDYVCLDVIGYDDDSDLEIDATWERNRNNIGNSRAKHYDLVDICIEEV